MMVLHRPPAALVLVAGVLACGCAVLREGRLPMAGRARAPAYTEELFARKPLEVHRLRRTPDGAPAETVIGRTATYVVREGETLLDVARYHDLGYNEIVDANPRIDPWLPPTGARIVLPMEWIVPCCAYEGIVVNIPEMRLYYFRPDPRQAGTILVHTYPVGLGRETRRTPRAKTRVRGKTVNPDWYIPESIRQEHIVERGDARRMIRGGHPDNPLGKYRFELTLPRYTIHGTNVPWGAGMPVSHGCVRLYPEDIEQLFPLVPVGTPVELVYQPVKVGRRGAAIYVEVHRDLYRYTPSLHRAAMTALGKRARGAKVDRARLAAALEAAAGVPVPVAGGAKAG